MTNFIMELCIGLKSFLREKLNLVVLLLIISLCVNQYNFIKLKKKIDHRYFNTTTTIQEIFDVKVNTLNGELK